MMTIYYHKKFKKAFKKLSRKMQAKVMNRIELFQRNPFLAQLKNHPLIGPLTGKRAFSVTGDYRVIFEEHEDYVLVIMLDVGTHSQVY